MAKEKIKKTAADYRMELMMLRAKIKSLEAKTAERLLDLCKCFPDADIGVQFGHFGSATAMKAKAIGSAIYIDRISVESRLEYIEAIEKWLAEQSPIKQTQIDFNTNEA